MRRCRKPEPRAIRLDAIKAEAHSCPASSPSRSASFSVTPCTASVSAWQALKASRSWYDDTPQYTAGRPGGVIRSMQAGPDHCRTASCGPSKQRTVFSRHWPGPPSKGTLMNTPLLTTAVLVTTLAVATSSPAQAPEILDLSAVGKDPHWKVAGRSTSTVDIKGKHALKLSE